MDLDITADIDEASGVGEVLISLWRAGYKRYFEARDYGSGLAAVGVVLMCANPELDFKRRLRFVKKDKILYMDIMLKLGEMKRASPTNRRKIIAQRIATEIPENLSRY